MARSRQDAETRRLPGIEYPEPGQPPPGITYEEPDTTYGWRNLVVTQLLTRTVLSEKSARFVLDIMLDALRGTDPTRAYERWFYSVLEMEPDAIDARDTLFYVQTLMQSIERKEGEPKYVRSDG